MGYEDIRKSVLEKVKLTVEEEKSIQKSSKEILTKIKKIGLKAEVGGSLAKGTLVKKNDQDVDIFVVLDKKNIGKLEEKFKKTKLNFEVVHGSRDYLKIENEEAVFEIIPVLKLKKNEKPENVTDFSLAHVKYVKSKINKNKKLADEVRLAKAFCFAQNCYGAESYIGGFSGYALEVLVCYYGSFMNFLKNIQKNNIIDPEKYFKNKSEIFRELNQSKLKSPLILIDPVYKYRNVCAGLTQETFDKFLVSVKVFLKSPSEKFFFREEFNLDEFLERATKQKLVVYQLNIKTDRQEGDIAGTKMKKFAKFLIKELEKKKQEIVEFEFVYNQTQESESYLAIKQNELIEIIGPRKDMKKAVQEFIKVRKKTYVSKGFVCSKEQVSIDDIFNRQKFTAEGMGVGFDWKKL